MGLTFWESIGFVSPPTGINNDLILANPFSFGSSCNLLSTLLTYLMYLASSKVGGRAVAYYMATTVLAVILGIILVTAIRPGSAAVKGDDEIEGVSHRARHIFHYCRL